MGYGSVIGRRYSWSDESLANMDRADYHRIAKSIGISRSYNHASNREVSWRHARGEFERPNFVHGEGGYENRNINWEKAAREYADELRRQARVKHEYVAMATGYCLVCGEREYARISETSYGVTVWRRVHSNPKMLGTSFFEGADDDREYFGDKEACSGSGWIPPDASRGERIYCFRCGRKTAVLIDGRLRRHFAQ